jgi:hypothetical protein
MELLEPILMFVLELFGEILLEGLFELGLEGVKQARGRENRHPLVASLGYLLLGAAIGVLWVWLVPGRILRGRALQGASLVLGPLFAGVVMEAWGRSRRAAGHATTNLATWYGGAAFALGIAVVRFFGVR